MAFGTQAKSPILRYLDPLGSMGRMVVQDPVSVLDTRAILRMDIECHVESRLWQLVRPLYTRVKEFGTASSSSQELGPSLVLPHAPKA